MNQDEKHWRNCFGHAGDDLPLPQSPGTLDELMDKILNSPSNPESYWRGQSNMLWVPYPTLFRRMRNGGFSDAQINESVIQMEERAILSKAVEANILENNADDGKIIELMAKLQHYGGPTRLLDVTSNPEIALFFASNGNVDRMGVIYQYRINQETTVDLNKQDYLWDGVLSSCEAGRPILVKPKPYDRRIEVQQGAFVLSRLSGSLADPNLYTNQTYDSEVAQYFISPDLKRQAKERLKAKGIDTIRLFPSIEKFSSYCASCPPFFRF